jgi:hypothetical protein
MLKEAAKKRKLIEKVTPTLGMMGSLQANLKRAKKGPTIAAAEKIKAKKIGRYV